MTKQDTISSFSLLSSPQPNHQAEETARCSTLSISCGLSTPIDPKHRFKTLGDPEGHVAINPLDQFLLFALP